MEHGLRGAKRQRDDTVGSSAVPSEIPVSSAATAAPTHHPPAAAAAPGPPKAKKQRQLTPYEAAFKGFRDALVDACKRGDALAALDLHGEMTKAKVLPTAFIYNTILAVCTRVTGRVEPAALAKAISVFECMYRSRMHPMIAPAASAAVAQAVSDAASTAAAAAAAAAAAGGSSSSAAAATAGDGGGGAALVPPPPAPAPKAGSEECLLRSARAVVLPSETAYTSIIRLCVLAGQVGDARHFFDRMLADGVTPRLRTYAPLFQAHATPGGDAAQLDELYADMRRRGIVPSQQEYSAYLTALGRRGRWADVSALLREMAETVYVVDGAPAPDPNGLSWHQRAARAGTDAAGAGGAAAAGAALASSAAAGGAPVASAPAAAAAAPGADVSDEALHALSGPSLLDTLEALFSGAPFPAGPLDESLHASAPSSSASDAVPQGGSSSCSTGSGSDGRGSIRDAGAAPRGWPQWQWDCRRVRIDAADGVCPLTGRRLQSLDLGAQELATLCEQIERLAGQAQAGGGGNSSSRNVMFSHFKDWLGSHAAFKDGGRGFDVVIDGPNVGFANQNFASGALMYTQIEAAVRRWERAGKRVLLVIGSRWLDPKYYGREDKRRPVKQKLKDAKAAATAASSTAAAGGGQHGAGAARGAGGSAWTAPRAAANVSGSSSSSSSSAAPSPPLVAPVRGGIAGARLSSGDAHHHGAGSSSSSAGSSSDDAFEEDDDYDEDEGDEEDDDREHDDDAGPPDDGDGAEPGDVPIALDAASDSLHARALVARWTDAGLVYRVPAGNNDDWFWLYATVLSQAAAVGAAAAAAAAAAASSPASAPAAAAAAAGSSVFLVSNDLMRDHHFAMLAPKAFLTWRERHQVRFEFQPTRGRGGGQRGFRPAFFPPLSHSHRAQVSPDGAVWHFPVSEARVGGEAGVWLACWRKGDVAVSAAALARADAAAAAERELVEGEEQGVGGGRDRAPATLASVDAETASRRVGLSTASAPVAAHALELK